MKVSISADKLQAMKNCKHAHTHEDVLMSNAWTVCDDCGKSIAVR